ncbi:DnaJ protein -like protein 1like [Caligus rogercresseyi]|uniref:DnaJ protein -like protein 1like n=1 Tax=Caligus rogercresseyi TaxID=217165 RepID=A0A7T8HG76_CALRO|nr:DnaJ protein -like protein 1like [Caligus rogercresseyi]
MQELVAQASPTSTISAILMPEPPLLNASGRTIPSKAYFPSPSSQTWTLMIILGVWAASFNVSGNPGGFGKTEKKVQDSPVEHDLFVSLEDIAKGVTKRMKISRRVVSSDGTARKEEKVLTINVKPGWKPGTKITFQREGDQAPNKIPADIIFIIRDKPHKHFTREGSDLKYVCKITLKEKSRTRSFTYSLSSRLTLPPQ